MNKRNGMLTAYFPIGNLKYDTLELARTYFRGGVDVLEIGIPAKDPYLDGDVIRSAMNEAADRNLDISWYFEEIKKIREEFPKDTGKTLEIFSYKEVFSEIGLSAFIDKMEAIGVDCALFTDMTDDELCSYYADSSNRFPLLKFLPFTTSDEKIQEYSKIPYKGYVFLQATDGCTGARDKLHPELGKKVERAKKMFSQPIYAGFGISSPEQAKEVIEMGADGIVIGSYVVSYLIEHSLEEVKQMFSQFKNAISS